MSILVTGGAGFIGNNLVRRLLNLGEHVIIVDNFISSQPAKSMDLCQHPNVVFIEKDVCKLTLLTNIKQIYHLACPASPPKYQAYPLETIQTCVNGTINVLEIAKANKCPILFTSTSEVYGEALISPQVETYRGNVSTIGIRACYDEGKRMAETIMFEYHRQFGVDVKVVRIFNTYGPYMDDDDGRVVTNFIKQATSGQNITIYGTGQQSRSFCYVDDLVRGLMLMMNSIEHGPINLGNPNEMTVCEVAQKVCEIVGRNNRDIGSSLSDLKITYKPIPQDDPTHRCPDITLARERLGWYPTVDITEGLSRTIEKRVLNRN